MNTSEVATYFGPPVSPLFGILHLPEDNLIRGGVIICGSLGREAMDSARLQRPLADGLARRGFAVLRFDYLGTGDSAFAQDRDDAVDLWRRSIGYALAYLEEIGSHSITAIALRAGGLILSDILAGSPSVDRVVYFDPVGTGRRYLREQTALATLSIGPEASPAGTVAITGARLSASAAKEFSALSLAIAPPAGVDHLLVLRSGLADTKVSALAEVDGVRSVTVDGLTEFARIAETLTPLPLPAVDTMIAWVDEAVAPMRTPATPQYLTSVKMPSEFRSRTDAVIESIESIGPDGLFAIRTCPEDCLPGEGDVVLFYSTAYDLHTGPMREWVELSRRITELGAQSLRFDHVGLGQSGPVSREQWFPVYSRRGIADAIAAAEHAAKDPRMLLAVGICSGSWYAAQAARVIGYRSVVMINSIIWNWRLLPALLWQWDVKRSISSSSPSEARNASKAEEWRKRVIVSMKPVRKAVQATVHASIPRFILTLLWRLGVAHVPEATIATLARAGTSATLVLSPSDAEEFGRKGGFSGFEQLKRASISPQFLTPAAGDHPSYHHAMLEAIRQTVMGSLSAPHNGTLMAPERDALRTEPREQGVRASQ